MKAIININNDDMSSPSTVATLEEFNRAIRIAVSAGATIEGIDIAEIPNGTVTSVLTLNRGEFHTYQLFTLASN